MLVTAVLFELHVQKPAEVLVNLLSQIELKAESYAIVASGVGAFD